MYHVLLRCLNPYCSGRWSRTIISDYITALNGDGLILVVVEDDLVRS